MSKDGVYVCADIGVNWRGKSSELMAAIKNVGEAGADAVKLQFFDEAVLESQYEPEMREKLAPFIMDPGLVYGMADWAHEKEIEMVVTPFSPELVGSLIGMPIDGLKVRAKDYLNAPLVAAVRNFGKPYYISFPGGSDGSISLPKGGDPEVLRDHWFETHTPMGHRVYCVPKYPPELTDLMLGALTPMYHGFSSHYPHPAVPILAAAMSLRSQMHFRKHRFYVEVHYRPEVGEPSEYPDWNVSLNPSQIRQVVNAVKVMEGAI